MIGNPVSNYLLKQSKKPMYNNTKEWEEDSHDYRPNELAQLAREHNKLYREIVQSNLEPDDTVEAWEQRNLEYMQKLLRSR